MTLWLNVHSANNLCKHQVLMCLFIVTWWWWPSIISGSPIMPNLWQCTEAWQHHFFASAMQEYICTVCLHCSLRISSDRRQMASHLISAHECLKHKIFQKCLERDSLCKWKFSCHYLFNTFAISSFNLLWLKNASITMPSHWLSSLLGQSIWTAFYIYHIR